MSGPGKKPDPDSFVTHRELVESQNNAELVAIKEIADALEEAVGSLRQYVTELEGSHKP